MGSPIIVHFSNTLRIFYRMVRKIQAGKPIFLIGYSLGALITSNWLLEDQNEFAGAVFIGPAVKVAETSPVKIFLFSILSAILPKAGFMAMQDDEAICKDPVIVEAYKADPLTFREKMTVRMAAQCLKAQIKLIMECFCFPHVISKW